MTACESLCNMGPPVLYVSACVSTCPAWATVGSHFMLSCHRLSFTGSTSTFHDWCMILGMELLPPSCQGAA